MGCQNGRREEQEGRVHHRRRRGLRQTVLQIHIQRLLLLPAVVPVQEPASVGGRETDGVRQPDPLLRGALRLLSGQGEGDRTRHPRRHDIRPLFRPVLPVHGGGGLRCRQGCHAQRIKVHRPARCPSGPGQQQPRQEPSQQVPRGTGSHRDEHRLRDEPHQHRPSPARGLRSLLERGDHRLQDREGQDRQGHSRRDDLRVRRQTSRVPAPHLPRPGLGDGWVERRIQPVLRHGERRGVPRGWVRHPQEHETRHRLPRTTDGPDAF